MTGLVVWNLKPTVTITSSSSDSATSQTSPSAAKIASDEAMLMTYMKQLEHLEKSKDRLLKSRGPDDAIAAQSVQHTAPVALVPVSSELAHNVAAQQEVSHSIPAELEQLAQKAREEVSSLRVEAAGVQTGHQRKGWSHWFWDSG